MSNIANEVGLYMLCTVCDIEKNYELQKKCLFTYWLEPILYKTTLPGKDHFLTCKIVVHLIYNL